MLDIQNLSTGYRPQSAVLSGVSFSAKRGEAIGLIGRNGAGKTCLALTLIGKLRAHGGSISLDGVDVTACSPRQRVLSGLSLVPEGRMIFGQLTVAENLIAAAYGGGRSVSAQRLADVQKMFPILGTKAHRQAASMSGGEQQMLAIARALLQEPKVMILDEPSLGLAPVAIDSLIQVLLDIRDRGVTLVLMEQNRQILRDVCRTTYLLDQGRITRSLSPEDLDDEQTVSEVFLG